MVKSSELKDRYRVVIMGSGPAAHTPVDDDVAVAAAADTDAATAADVSDAEPIYHHPSTALMS